MLGDMAFVAGNNSHGQTAVALSVGINFLKVTNSGGRLIAEATEQTASGPIALYDITIRDDQTGELVAKSQDLVYRKKNGSCPMIAAATLIKISVKTTGSLPWSLTEYMMRYCLPGIFMETIHRVFGEIWFVGRCSI